MQKLPELAGMDLAALLCSRVCHDVISPVGAIANGIELLDEGADEETSEIAMDLIRSSAKNASARLQYARIAFGAAGSAGAHIDTGDAENVARAFFDNEKKTDIEWHGERALMATFEETLDAHAIQPVYTLQLAEASQMEVAARLAGEDVVFEAHIATQV